jgi:centrosomal protein CEP41
LKGDQLIAKRRGEKFKRIKCSTLARLLVQNTTQEESIYQLGQGDGMDSVSVVAGQNAQMAPNMNEESKDNQSNVSMRTGVSQATAVTYATEMIGITAQTSFLLLDLRDQDEYNLWRIKESINFPAPNIARDKMIPELFRFKNQPDKLIIVYMLDERAGT